MHPAILSAIVVLCATACVPANPEPYLGLEVPGSVAEVFAPGLVSLPDRYEYGSVFSDDGLELFYGVNVESRAEIRSIGWTGEAWSEPVRIIGDDRYTYGDPYLSRDGMRLYFISNRPLSLEDPEAEPKDFDIWFIERLADDWGEPINLGSPVNSGFDEYYISFADNGRIYFASNRNGGERERNFDIFSASPSADGFDLPIPLPGGVNTRYYEADAFVAPDESYIVYGASRPGGLGKGDLYLSVRDQDGSWSEGLPMGDGINSEGHELCPFVSADGKWFFFTSKEDIRWVRADVLDAIQRGATSTRTPNPEVQLR